MGVNQSKMNYIQITKENIDKEHIITTKEAAQNVHAPVTTYALFRDGTFVTQGIRSDKKFLALAGVKEF